MADKPILFSGPLVRALLARTKNQTRRANHLGRLRRFGPITEFGRSDTRGYDWHFRDKSMRWHDLRHAPLLQALPWQLGDRLWVREAWTLHDRAGDVGTVAYQASFKTHGWTETIQQFPRDLTLATRVRPVQLGWRPSIHMPRWASRLTLTVTDVRVERLQDCSEEDAAAEGVQFEQNPLSQDAQRYFVEIGGGEVVSGWDARDCYGSLWEHINGAGSWSANPWVAAYTFTVAHANIDALARAA